MTPTPRSRRRKVRRAAAKSRSFGVPAGRNRFVVTPRRLTRSRGGDKNWLHHQREHLVFMRTTTVLAFSLFSALLLAPGPVSGHVLDNFDDNVKTDWQDFTFIPGFGIPSEADGQFH